MTLTPAIIKEAYRESNLIAIGVDPNANQSAEGLTLLNRVVAGAYGYEVGDPLFDWPVGNSNVVAVSANEWTQTQWADLLQNVRVIMNADTAQTLYLPPDPEDGARVAVVDPAGLLNTYNITLDGNGRQIVDAATRVLSVASATTVLFYRADLGKWVLLSDLTGAVDEEFPFPAEFDDYFITKLAMRLNPRYGRSLGEESAAALVTALRKLRAHYRQTQVFPCDLGAVALTSPYGGRGSVPNVVRNRIGWMR